ncbi:MAG: PAS domain S-box protein [Bacteroidales bacterium]|nr:PAS domain S-box protein [Bacteroidales bacterium]
MKIPLINNTPVVLKKKLFFAIFISFFAFQGCNFSKGAGNESNISVLIVLLVFFLTVLMVYVVINYIRNKRNAAAVSSFIDYLAGKVQPAFTGEETQYLPENDITKGLRKIEIRMKELEARLQSRISEIENQHVKLQEKQKETERQNLELKSAYEALLESRKRYEQLIDNLKDEYIFFSQSPSGEMLFASPSVKTILGYSVNEFRNIKNDIFTENELNIAAREHIQGSLKGIKQPKYLVELSDKEGTPHVLEITEFPVFNENDEFIAVEGIARDITKGIRAEDIIKEKEEKYKLLFNKASDFVFFYSVGNNSLPGRFIEVNDYTVSRLGYTKDELLGMTLNDLADVEIWEDEPPTDDFTGNKKYEQIWTTKDGEMINVEIVSHNFKLKSREIGIAIARDITDRKRVEEEIRYFNEELVNQKENLEALVDNLTQTQEQLVHSEKMAALGQLIAGVAHEINTPLGAIKASIGNLQDSLKKALEGLPVFLEKQTTASLQLFNKILEYSSGQGEGLTTREKRKIRKETEIRLEAEGIQSAATIADLMIYLDICQNIDELLPLLKNNGSEEVMQSARNFISILKNSNTISLASDKAAKTVFALKKYAHRDLIEEKIPTDIIDGLETVLTLYHNQLKQGIEVIRKFDDLPVINAYPDDLNQVWTNLIHNSIHAMNQKGVLIITVRNENDYITISIADNGCGIEPDIRDKIFDPFFTTKKQGEGSGLGLDIVKRIVEKHNGMITFTSELGQGTEFTIKLPVN